jgi:2-keto-4-pentenoate hydratase
MSFTATVENDVIKLPGDTHLPNGSTVRVELVDNPRISPEIMARLKKISGRATTGLTTDEILRETRGED